MENQNVVFPETERREVIRDLGWLGRNERLIPSPTPGYVRPRTARRQNGWQRDGAKRGSGVKGQSIGFPGYALEWIRH